MRQRASASGPPDTGFRPELGFWTLTLLVVGSIVGSGIFFLPGPMLADAGSVPMVMLAWVGGAVIALCGGLMFAELGAAYPRAGGQSVFLREGLGRLPAFLFSWTGFTVVQTGTVAALAVAFAAATDRVLRSAFGVALPGNRPCLGELDAAGTCTGFALPPWGQGFLAVAIVAGLTLVNHRGVRQGAFVNSVATAAKLLALVAVVALALPAEGAGNFGPGGGFGDVTLGGFGLALAASLFAYDGFAQATFVAGEVKDARRTVPRAIVTAGVAVAALYLLATFAYFHMLPADRVTLPALDGDTPIAIEALEHAYAGTGAEGGGFLSGAGPTLAIGLAAAIAVSTFGTANAYILAGPRVYHPVAQEGAFPRAFAVLSRHRTPTYGLWYSAIWAGILAMTGGFDTLADLTVFGLYFFYVLTAVAYFRLRVRDPAAFGSFRVPLRPLPAIVFAAGSVAVLVSYLVRDIPALGSIRSGWDVLPNTSLVGALLIASGLLVHAGLRRRAAH